MPTPIPTTPPKARGVRPDPPADRQRSATRRPRRGPGRRADHRAVSPGRLGRPTRQGAARRPAGRPWRPWSSSTPPKAATRAHRPTAGCRARRRRPGVVALAFHVDYWDRLGWKDPFGSRTHTERQAAQQRVNGARFSYTPQGGRRRRRHACVAGGPSADHRARCRGGGAHPHCARRRPLPRHGSGRRSGCGRRPATRTPGRVLGRDRGRPRVGGARRRERRRDADARPRGARTPAGAGLGAGGRSGAVACLRPTHRRRPGPPPPHHPGGRRCRHRTAVEALALAC